MAEEWQGAAPVNTTAQNTSLLSRCGSCCVFRQEKSHKRPLLLRAGKKCRDHTDEEQRPAKSDGHHIPRRKSIISISIRSQRLVDRIRHLLNGDQETDGEE